MGQRHQIYFIFPKEFAIKMYEDSYEEKVVEHYIIPMHHQWLYGQIAIKQLMYFLRYCRGIVNNEEEYHPLINKTRRDEIPFLLKSLYSTNPEGYYHSVSVESKELADDPNLGDNNDGITIIDLRNIEKVKYCLMFLWDQENDDEVVTIEAYKPLTAKEYVDFYYPQRYLDKLFNYNEEGDEDSFKEETTFIISEIERLSTLMTKEEVLELFPTLHYNPEHEIDHDEENNMED